MNGDTSGGRGRRVRRRQTGVLAAAVGGIAVLVAACGGGGSPAAAGSSTYQKALAFSQCMRGHGEPGWPDPNSNGGFSLHGNPGTTGGSVLTSANKACQPLLPKSAPLTVAQQRQVTSQALKYLACIRSHGIPAFPDPVVNGGNVTFNPPAGVSPGSPRLRPRNRPARSSSLGGRDERHSLPARQVADGARQRPPRPSYWAGRARPGGDRDGGCWAASGRGHRCLPAAPHGNDSQRA